MTWYPCEISTTIGLSDIEEEMIDRFVVEYSTKIVESLKIIRNPDVIEEIELCNVSVLGNFKPRETGSPDMITDYSPPEPAECEVMSIKCGELEFSHKYFNNDFFKRVIELLCERAESDAKEQYDDRYDK